MIGWRLKLAVFLFYSALCVAFGAWVVDNKWQSDWDSHMLDDAQANEKAANAALNQQRELLTELEKAQENEKQWQKKYAKTVADNDAANKRLRDEFNRLKTLSKTDDSGSVISSAAAETDRLVLAQLLESSHAAYGILARYADKNRQAVINCNAEYNAIRKSIDGR